MKKNVLKNNTANLIPIKSIIGYSVLAIISGLSGFGFITIINKIISMSMKGELATKNDYLFMFLGTIAVFFITRKWLSSGIIKLSQKMFWNMRRDVVKLILKAPYRKLQEYKDEVYSTLTSDVNNIVNASLIAINFFSSIILIAACLIYMAYLSISLFAMCLGVIAIGVTIYLVRSRKSNQQIKEVRELERGFVNIFNSILGGAKEININKDKGEDIYENRLKGITVTGEKTYVKAFVKYLNSEIISQLLFYALVTFILVYGDKVFSIPLDVTVSFVFVLLYVLGPIVNIMTTIPIINRAKVSFSKMNKLKTELQSIEGESNIETSNKEKYYNFNKLEIQDYSFSYGEDKFSVGPISLEIDRNEVVFVYGGNGAGKTTFINTILQLYNLESGNVLVDDIPVPEERVENIKEMFSPVFSDFYLFDEFYGIKDVDVDKVNHYLDLFELTEKVTVENNKFSTTNLSTGQRKRLALISALLEDRPILVLDEWAADQDPHFRKKFYEEIIPIIIEQEDKTIIAITHDDRYYDKSDKLLKMEYGRLVEVNRVLETVF